MSCRDPTHGSIRTKISYRARTFHKQVPGRDRSDRRLMCWGLCLAISIQISPWCLLSRPGEEVESQRGRMGFTGKLLVSTGGTNLWSQGLGPQTGWTHYLLPCLPYRVAGRGPQPWKPGSWARYLLPSHRTDSEKQRVLFF